MISTKTLEQKIDRLKHLFINGCTKKEDCQTCPIIKKCIMNNSNLVSPEKEHALIENELKILKTQLDNIKLNKIITD